MGQLILAELIIGMTLGLMVQIFFEGVRIMGQMVGFQTGFAITNVIDPQSGTQVSIFANLAYFVAITLFLLLNGHHILLNAVRDSFDIINVGSLALNVVMLKKMITISGDVFVDAVEDLSATNCSTALYKPSFWADYKAYAANEYYDCCVSHTNNCRAFLFWHIY